MVKVIGQDIPSEDAFKYSSSLRPAVTLSTLGRKYGTFKYGEAKYGSSFQSVQRRYPFRQPYKQNSSPHSPTAAQRAARGLFKRCSNCFRAQPKSGGVTPPAIGPRNREFWYTSSGGSGLFYYDYFMQQSLSSYYGPGSPDEYPFTPIVPDWCKAVPTDSTYAYSVLPNTNQGTGFPVWIEAHHDPGNFVEIFRAFVRFDNHPISYLSLAGVFNTVPEGATSIYLEAWDIGEPWVENTLTWNNMPALGKKLGRVLILDEVSPIEFSFSPSGPYGVALRFTSTSIPSGQSSQLIVTSGINGI